MTRRLAYLAAVAFGLAAACNRHAQAPSADNANTPAPITVRAGDDQVTLTLSADRDHVRFEETVDVRVSVAANPNVVVSLDDYTATLDRQPFGYGYRLLSSADAVPSPDGMRQWTREYRLTFLVPKDHQLPPVTLTYVTTPASVPNVPNDTGTQPTDNSTSRNDNKASSSSEPVTRKLATEPLVIHVDATDQLNIPQDQLAQLQSPKPVALPAPLMSRWWPWAMMAASATTAAAVWWLKSRRRALPAAPPEPAHVWAERQLECLLAERLLEDGRVQEFYFRLSDIVRMFTERRFGLTAPEMTTEEFLQAALAGEVLGESNKASLGAFLAACDMVKFALYVPDARANTEAIDKARGYIRAMSSEPTPGARVEPPIQSTNTVGAAP